MCTTLRWCVCVRREIVLDDESEEHTWTRHQVTPAEVEQVVHARPGHSRGSHGRAGSRRHRSQHGLGRAPPPNPTGAMTPNNRERHTLNRKELLEMCACYDTHSTADEMENGRAKPTLTQTPWSQPHYACQGSFLTGSVSRQPESTSSRPLWCDDGSNSVTPTNARLRVRPSAWIDSNRPCSTKRQVDRRCA